MEIEIKDDKVVKTITEEIDLTEYIKERKSRMEYHQQQAESILAELESLIEKTDESTK